MLRYMPQCITFTVEYYVQLVHCYLSNDEQVCWVHAVTVQLDRLIFKFSNYKIRFFMMCTPCLLHSIEKLAAMPKANLV